MVFPRCSGSREEGAIRSVQSGVGELRGISKFYYDYYSCIWSGPWRIRTIKTGGEIKERAFLSMEIET